jgi:restriction system protein
MARAHLEARQAEVELANADLQNQIADIDSLLAATLAVDDYIDLEKLRVTPDHPPFTSANTEPLPTPALPQPPGQPPYQEPSAPTGIAGLFGKKKHQQTVDAARAAHEDAMRRWTDQAAAIPGQQLQIMNAHQAAEQQRLERLRTDAANYEAECQQRQRQADESNARLDTLIADLAAGRSHAVEEYLTIVFSNSVYPSYFPGVTDVTFDQLTGELTLNYSFPHPDELPTVRQYRYVTPRTKSPQPARRKRSKGTATTPWSVP